jgi:exonuclease III
VVLRFFIALPFVSRGAARTDDADEVGLFDDDRDEQPAVVRLADCDEAIWVSLIEDAEQERVIENTFWDYLRQAWERNAGMRLDHILLSASLVPRLRETGVDAWVRGLPGASDHAPAWPSIETNPPSSTSSKSIFRR